MTEVIKAQIILVLECVMLFAVIGVLVTYIMDIINGWFR